MKKIFYFLSISLCVFSLFSIASAQTLGIGSRGDEVRAIQEILKEDPNIYPEGLVTGYFGRLTKGAIKRLQKKFGLTQTGVLDKETEKVVFPDISVKVVSPNGGENWDRSQLHLIKWEASTQMENETFSKVKWVWPKVSIDLFRKTPDGTSSESVFVKHIAFVPYWKGSYSWRISRDIPNGSDYVIRVTAVRRSILPCIVSSKKREVCLRQRLSLAKNWDESDSAFTISGEVSSRPVPDLSKVIEMLRKISGEINRVIGILEEFSGN